MIKRISMALAALALLMVGAEAAGPPVPAPSSVLCNACTASLSVTNSSSRVILPQATSAYNTLTIYNAGSKTAFYRQGDVTSVATTSDIPLIAGARVTVWASGTYVAAITGGSDTTTLKVYQSNGPIEFSAPAGTAIVVPVTPTPNNSAGAFTNVTVGTSSGSVLAANTAKVYLFFQNLSTSATICLNAGGAATITGTQCSAGEITLAPNGGGYVAESSYVPSDQWFAISSASSTPLTVGSK